MSDSMLDYLLCAGRLKRTPRTGWVMREVDRPESVAEHQFRLALMAMSLADKFGGAGVVDRDRAIRMCLVHDLAESIVGDIVPTQFSGVTEADKNAQEARAMQTIGTQHLRAHSSLGSEVTLLWQEYAAGATLEARFVKQLDKVEMLIQAYEYEVEQPHLELDEFFAWVAASKKVDDPCLLALLDEIQARRRALGRSSTAPFTAVSEPAAAVVASDC